MRRTVPWLTLLLLATTAPGQQPAAAPARIALYIAIDEYVRDDSIQDLRGCVNDMQRLREVLQARYGFRPPRVRMLQNAQATRDAIRDAFWWLMDETQRAYEAGARDIVVVFGYAGHGGLLKSKDDDEAKDTTILPTDAGKRYERHIRDDDVNRVLGRLQEEFGATVVYIRDACHSGTSYRSAEFARVRSAVVPGEPLAESPEDSLFDGSDGRPALPNRANPSLVYLGAVFDGWLAEEGTDPNGNACGKFSWTLFRVLSTARPGMTWAELHRKVLNQFQLDWRDSRMIPPAEISPALRTRVCFGDRVAPMHARILPGKRDEGSLPLSLGSLHGVTEGARFRFYRDLSDLDDRMGAIATATVVAVDAEHCVARLDGPLPPGSEATVVARLDAVAYPAFRVGTLAELPATYVSALERIGVSRAGSGEPFDVALKAFEDGVRVYLPGRLPTEDGTGSPLFGPLGPQQLEDVLALRARIRGLLDLERNTGEIAAEARPHAGHEGEELEAVGGVRRFRSPAAIDIVVPNPLDRPVYVFAFYHEQALDDPARSAFDLFFPGSAATNYRIEPGAALTLKFPDHEYMEWSTGYRAGARFVVKLLVSEKPYDVDAFALLKQRTGVVRDGVDDLQWLLHRAAGGHAAARDASNAARGWWATASLVFDLVP